MDFISSISVGHFLIVFIAIAYMIYALVDDDATTQQKIELIELAGNDDQLKSIVKINISSKIFKYKDYVKLKNELVEMKKLNKVNEFIRNA